MPLSPSAAREIPQSPLTEWIVSHRRHLYVGLFIFYLFAFNGQWRVGRDSALYRGLGHSLATGKGYTFGEFGSRQIYPGLPLLLAGLEKVFGSTAWPAIVMMHLLSWACIIVTYKLVRLRFPYWFAITVAVLMAFNGWYMELTNEIRDDLPFLLGMMTALYGWERLRIAVLNDQSRDRKTIVRSIAFLLIGLALAAVMRPTFWILAIGWVMVCAWGLVTGPRRRFYAVCLGTLLIVWFAVAMLDPRVRGFSPLGGGYENDAIKALRGRSDKTLSENVISLVTSEFSYGFFGQKWFPGMTQAMTIIAIAASLLLLRTNPLWTLLILLTVVVTLLMTVVPRYYVMILPLLVIAWLLLFVNLATRVPHRWMEVVLLIGIAMFVLPNIARCFKVIGEQRNWGQRRDELPKWKDVMEMSEQVNKLVPPGEKVIAPGASIMAYLSGREALMQRDIIPRNKSEIHWPTHLAALNIHYAIFPSKLYKGGERKIRELMDKNVIVPVERVVKVGELVLLKVEIRVPPAGQDWRKRSVTTRPINARTTASGSARPTPKMLKKRRQAIIAARHAAAVKKEARDRKLAHAEREKRLQAAARLAAKTRKDRIARRAAAKAATAPSTQPAGAKPAISAPVKAPAIKPSAYLDEDVGGFSGQSSARRSDSICFNENLRLPWLIPWQRCPADSHDSLLASTPSQNGHVRHCSGRTS
jgi:hypothetical protein